MLWYVKKHYIKVRAIGNLVLYIIRLVYFFVLRDSLRRHHLSED
ncbi:hypothetical protein TOT_020000734 [Theileria orientalis strain Shintoku]|uniref:Uncharacterized protein n=1 Tax=Theileria orientalis strain Shintoku TaxID=869250 RepID=J4C8B1_THEOR|nr:hypothetical protein TOT_020000734 [Theileria orientalis strain Shintoku]BAM40478.1 hypothetical protein TOT_020000734 [Theileria orientalis strain Shintoku]|eukprot:XP_009690779.1 hypothetical protein TOT_020000734 [Theileria orientalis strain Shintoku]